MPLVDDLRNVKFVHWKILQYLLPCPFVVIEVTDISSVGFHKELVSHFKNCQGSTQEEAFNSKFTILEVQFRAQILLRE